MKIIFYGLVQGVGFRPAVYRVAKSLGLSGYIRNNGSNVEVVIDRARDEFLERLNSELPPLAEITRTEFEEGPPVEEYNDFSIVLSEDGERSSVIPTDTAICDGCLSELFDENDRRHLYPFINCTDCGARFSAIASVPYDRINTSMKDFPLCSQCTVEYDDPMNRRFYAQTISCRDDGPHFTLFGAHGKKLDSENAIAHFANLIDDCAIGVLKSWGGMHLICKLDILDRFRKWYKRPHKPFAVMARNLQAAGELAEIPDYAKQLLTSLQRPIVIVQKREDKRDDPLLDLVSPGLDNIGLYLPYSAIQHILFRYLKSDAIVMTSANPPGEPIVIDNDEVFKMGVDVYMLHNRNIINRIDDTVLIPYEDRRFFIRKSRGFVPLGLDPNHDLQVVSVGPEENLTTGVSTQGTLYTSQYIGDVRKYNVYQFMRSATHHLMNLFGIESLDGVACDLHPLYTSRKFADELGENFDAEVMEVQHHFAHAVSLMVDNEIAEDIVCLTLDGVGYGTDGNLWGGEVMLASYTDFERTARLEYLPLIGGDKAVEDPRRVVFAIQSKLGAESDYFDDMIQSVFLKALEKSPSSCSFGRYLDAISCYLGVCCKKTYEGEPAIKLERFLERGKPDYDFKVNIKGSNESVIETVPIFGQLFDYSKGKELSLQERYDLAHSMVSCVLDSMVDIAVHKAYEKGLSKIGLTGGVSYNLPIVRMVKEAVEKNGLTFITHNNVPNGDGGISVGQNAIVGNLLKDR